MENAQGNWFNVTIILFLKIFKMVFLLKIFDLYIIFVCLFWFYLCIYSWRLEAHWNPSVGANLRILMKFDSLTHLLKQLIYTWIYTIVSLLVCYTLYLLAFIHWFFLFFFHSRILIFLLHLKYTLIYFDFFFVFYCCCCCCCCNSEFASVFC